MIEITINGESKNYSRPVAVVDLLQSIAMLGKKVAVERNGEIVPRASYATTMIANGDRLEIVVAVGGG